MPTVCSLRYFTLLYVRRRPLLQIWKELSGIQGQMRHAMAEVGSRRTSADERLRGVEVSAL